MKIRNRLNIIDKYELKKNLPELKAGAIFEHRDYDDRYPDRGNRGCGVLILAKASGKKTQSGWMENTYIFPGQAVWDKDWFRKITEEKGEFYCTINKCFSNCEFHSENIDGCLSCNHYEINN